MRVQLRSRRRDESGAIALLAAFLATALCVVAAFTVDFGIAYVSKQQLQEGADAGALAAAQVYKGKTGVPCATLAADSTLKAEAQSAADAWAEQNRPGKRGGTIAVSCPGTSTLTVTYTTEGDTGVGLGQLAGVGDKITTSTVAAATIGKGTAGDLRPWGICSAVANTTGQVVFVPMKRGSTTSLDSDDLCGPEDPPGDWYVMKCAGQGNGTGATEDAVTYGCDSTHYAPVPNQPTTGPGPLYSFLKAACPKNTSNTTNCLKADPGNNFHLTSDEWQPLVGQTFTMPVICGPSTCSQLEYDAQGNNIVYGIHRMATVELCGYKMKPNGPSTGWPTTGPCATANPNHYAASDVTNGAGFFLVIKDLVGGPTGDWSLAEYKNLRLTK